MSSLSPSFARPARVPRLPQAALSPARTRAKPERAGAGARFLLLSLVFIQFFPIPRFGIFVVAPENILFFFALIYLLLFGLRALHSQGKVLAMLGLMLLYGLLDQFHNLYLGRDVSPPMEIIRTVVYLAMFCVVCRYEAEQVSMLRTLLIVGVLQVLFGSLVYFIGEPFASIRAWMNGTRLGFGSDDPFIAKGSQMAGLYCLPSVFAYLIASFPLLGVILTHIRNNRLWLLLSVFMLIGVLLNAERSAMAAIALTYGLWSIKTGQKLSNLLALLFFLGAAAGIGLGIKQYQPDLRNPHEHGSYAHGDLSDRLEGTNAKEVGGRLMWQVYGALSVLKSPLLGPSQAEYAAEMLHMAKPSAADIARVPPPHNHYVNIGMHAGIGGWLIFAYWLKLLLGLNKATTARLTDRPTLSSLHLGIGLALLAAMLNGLFHNAGVFSPELATSSLLGLLLAQSYLAVPEPARSSRVARAFR